MDFSAALAVLQSRQANPETGDPAVASAAESLQAGCALCDDENQSAIVAEDDAEQPTAAAPPLSAASSTAQVLQLFLAQQEERVGVYRKFEEGFELFLRVAEAQGYQALVARSTAAFAVVSKRVNAVEEELRSRGASAAALAATVRTVQELEREKLQITAQLHILRHGMAIDELHSEQDDGADEAGSSKAARAARMRAEEAAGLRDRLSTITESLNDAIDEIRCELADAAEDDGDAAMDDA